DGRTLVTSRGSEITLWDLAGERVRSFGKGHDSIYRLAFSPDGRTLILPCGAESAATSRSRENRSVMLMECLTGEEPLRLGAHPGQIRALAISANARIVASAGNLDPIRLWDASSGKDIGPLTGHRGQVYSLVFSPNSKLLASTIADGTVLLWDVESLASKANGENKPTGFQGTGETLLGPCGPRCKASLSCDECAGRPRRSSCPSVETRLAAGY